MKFNFSKLYQRLQTCWWMLRDYESDRARASIKISFSQQGEDLTLWQIFTSLNISHPFYLDIGAHDPRDMSNTMFFYFRGSHGINVEPAPQLCEKFYATRPRDTNLNIGVGVKEGTFKFYRMNPPYISTFNKTEMMRMVEEEHFTLEDVLDIPILRINQLFEQAGQPIDLLSIDTEGDDLIILQDLDFANHRPKVICVETLRYSAACGNQKLVEIGAFLNQVGYQEYADTKINTIFTDRDLDL